MAENLPKWDRPYFKEPGGMPFLFYAVYGNFDQLPPLSRSRYRSEGLYPGFDLQHYDRTKHSEVLTGFQSGYLWEQFQRSEPLTAQRVQQAEQCMIIRGEIEDPSDLSYLRDTIGLLTYLADLGGIALYDPLQFAWWTSSQWRERFFEPAKPLPHRHVVILTSPQETQEPLTWFHTRGLRKFGRPDLSVTRVPLQYHEAVTELCNRFIEFQALGGTIEEGKEIRMERLPGGMLCHHAGDLEDPEFNNVHMEITLPLTC